MTEAERLLLILVADAVLATTAITQGTRALIIDARIKLDAEAFAEYARANPQRHAQGVEAPVGYHEAQQRLNAREGLDAGNGKPPPPVHLADAVIGLLL